MLAGHISATKVQLARARVHAGQIILSEQRVFNNHEFDNFDIILEKYLKNNTSEIKSVCFGVAGTVIGDEIVQGSFPWTIDIKSVKSKYAFPRMQFVNDLVATASGIFELQQDKFYSIKNGIRSQSGNIGLLAGGAGLGEALIYFDGDRYMNCASEGGHASFSPGNQIELELWEYLYSERPKVEAEDIISLRGLENIYNFLVDRSGGEPAEWYQKSSDRPNSIIEMALSGKGERASHTLEIFLDCLATKAANLAVTGLTVGGIFLGGVIVGKVITSLNRDRFTERFVGSGQMQQLLERIPVTVILDDTAVLLGAGCLALGI